MATFSNERRRRRLPHTPASAVAREAASREMESFMVVIVTMLLMEKYERALSSCGYIKSSGDLRAYLRMGKNVTSACPFRCAACSARVFSR